MPWHTVCAFGILTHTQTHWYDLLWCCQKYVATTYKQFTNTLNGGNLSWNGKQWFSHAHAHHKTDMHTLIQSYNRTIALSNIAVNENWIICTPLFGVQQIKTQTRMWMFIWTWKFECEHTVLSGAESKTHFPKMKSLQYGLCFLTTNLNFHETYRLTHFSISTKFQMKINK